MGDHEHSGEKIQYCYSWGIFEVAADDVTIELLKDALSLDKILIGRAKEVRLKKFAIGEGDKCLIQFLKYGQTEFFTADSRSCAGNRM